MNDKRKADWEKCLKKANDIAQYMIPQKLKNMFPDTASIAVVGLYLAVFVVIVGSISVFLSGKHDLSGMYQTADFFPFSQIEFDKSGHFTAVYYNGGYTETYNGKYKKQYNGEYICRFAGGSSSGGNPVMELEAENIGEQCEVGVKKVNENTLEVWIIPKIGYWAWNGKFVYFYK